MQSNLLPLAKESVLYILFGVLFLALAWILDFDFLVFIAFCIILFIGFSFRNPERALCTLDSTSFLSPVDGIVQSIQELENHQYAYKIEIQSGYTDVSVLRVPSNATVSKFIKRNGARTSKDSKLFESLNENVEIHFTTNEDNTFKVVHTLQRSFAPLFIELDDTQKLIQTARYGLMLNGSTAIYLPQNFRVNITIGSELKASESLMGYFS